jgi:hypothetical protein
MLTATTKPKPYGVWVPAFAGTTAHAGVTTSIHFELRMHS